MKNQTGSPVLSKILSVALVLILLSAIAALAYNIAVPPVTEKFTEFYVLNSEGKADSYPQNLAVGENRRVIIGIVNREREQASYRLEVKINQVKTNELGPLILEQGEKWEQTITFQPSEVGDKQKVEFLLYKSGQPEVYRSVYLLINVK